LARAGGGPAAVLVLLACTALIASCGSGSDGQDVGRNTAAENTCVEPEPSPYALWSEFLPAATVRAQVPALRSHGISLYQNVRSDRVDARDPDTAALLADAACEGLEVRAWLTLPEEEGYWPNEENADLFTEKALDLAGWIRSSGWPIDWIVVDMEPGLGMMNDLIDRFEAGDLAGALGLLEANLDPARYAESLVKYSMLVGNLHDLGFKVMVVTFPLVLDDLADLDPTIQDALNTPVDGIAWDEISFMAYTTIMEKFLGVDITPYMVYSYGRDAVRAYPDRAAVDIGIIGRDGLTGQQGITSIQEIRAQVGAAKAAGITNLHAYALDGIVSMEDPEEWFKAFQAPPREFKAQFTVDLVRDALALVDALF
jgi:hypothetical protein